MSITITKPTDGDILNHRHGVGSDAGLEIVVRGCCPRNSQVTVNGKPARVEGEEFTASVCLSQRETVLKAEAGDESDSVVVLYDRKSVRRYRFSLDDNIWFLRDIAQEGYASIFENPYMALWKRLHDTYGTKIVCNIYYQCEGFNLTMMPDRYKAEWADNGDWFRLTFHALQDEPRDPYLHATYDAIAKDYDLVVNEILRFAGEEVMDTFTTIHWGEATVEACRAVRDRGIRGLCGYFLVENGAPRVAYYLDAERTAHLSQRDYWKDTQEDLFFVRHAIVCNFPDLTPEKIGDHLTQLESSPGQGEVLEMMIHEQYFYPDYVVHLPDYAERCESAVRWAAENGYQPVFWSEGFVGNPRQNEP